MVLSSVQVGMDSTDWQQSVMHQRTLKPLEDGSIYLPACSRPIMEQTHGLKPPEDQKGLKCPRCASFNTKFCYYNNYSLSQPRHFCKTCKRYWTRGGTLRNVPVGGGCRKNKRPKRTIDQTAPISAALSSHTSGSINANVSMSVTNSAHLGGSLIPNSLRCDFPTNTSDHNMALAALRLGDQRALSLGFLRNNTSFDLQNNLSALSSLNTFSALNSLDSFKPNFNSNGSTLVRDVSNIFESYPQQNISISQPLPLLNAANPDDLVSPYALPLDGCKNLHQWRLEEQAKLEETSHVQRRLVAFPDHENLTSSPNENLKAVAALPVACIKVEDEENRLVSSREWPLQPLPVTNLFESGDTSCWNGGTWTDLSSYGSSISRLI